MIKIELSEDLAFTLLSVLAANVTDPRVRTIFAVHRENNKESITEVINSVIGQLIDQGIKP